MRVFQACITVLLLSFAPLAKADKNMRALRVDPSYFARLYPNATPEDITSFVISKANDSGTNTLFLYAYSSLHGAYYPTEYPMTEVEEQMGRHGIFNLFYERARAAGMKVIAVIPINDFHMVWVNHPDWRSKNKNGDDYKPFERTHYLSAWHPEYRKWFQGFVNDLLAKFPKVYAVEVVEPTVDCFWTGEPDYNPAANAAFKKYYPKGTPGDSDWKKVRALGLTQMISELSTIAHARGVLSAAVQTWPASPEGPLLTSGEVRDHVGFDFDEVLNLRGPQKVDLITAEFLWQQWAAEYGPANFTPTWTTKVSRQFEKFVRNRSTPIVHVEISPWHGQFSSVTPTLQEFRDTLLAIRDLGMGLDVYDHSQIEDRQAWGELSVWKAPTDYTKDAE